MNKFITIMFATLLMLSLTGCGGGTTSSASDADGINPPASGNSSVTLSWTPPSTKVDGSGLDDLDGYQILYGTSSDALTSEIIITNPSISTYVIEGLSPATYYFVVRAYNTNGVRAPYSNIAEVPVT